MKNEEIDRLFKQKADLFRADPSPQAWQQLEKQLQHKRGKKIGWYLSGAAACLVLLAGIWLNMEYSSTYINSGSNPIVQQVEPEIVTPTQTAPNVAFQTETDQAQKRSSQEAAQSEEKKLKNLQASRITTQTDNDKDKSTTSAVHRQGIEKEGIKDALTEKNKLPVLENKTTQALDPLGTGTEMQTAAIQPDELKEEIIIRYSMGDSENESFAATPEHPVAANEEARDLSPRALVGFLKKVKENSKGSLADIREAKDELLSIRLGR